jgi:hypothetical protein
MDPETIFELLEGKLHHYTCPQCQQEVHLKAEILISCRGGGFNVSTGDPLDVIRQKFREFGVVDDAGHLIDTWPRPLKPEVASPLPNLAGHLAARKKNVQDLISQLHAELQDDQMQGKLFENHYGSQIENIRLKIERGKGTMQLDQAVAALWEEIQVIRKRRGGLTDSPT